MHIKSILIQFQKFLDKGACDNVTDSNLDSVIYESSLTLGLKGYRSYSEAAEILNIKQGYLYTLISLYKDEIGKPFHNKTLGKCNLLSIRQIEILASILNCK